MLFASKAQDLVVELLLEVFLECLPEDGLARIRENEAPLSVSQVCRHWRSVALSAPRLWARLYMEYLNDEYAMKNALPSLRVFLQRSGTSNFHFKIDCSNEVPIDVYYNSSTVTVTDRFPIEAILEELRGHAGRIKRLALSAKNPTYNVAFQFVRQGALPALDYLYLEMQEGPEDGTTRLDGRFWRSISTSRSLELRGAHGQCDFDGDDVECADLRTLVIVDIDMAEDDLLRILKAFPALTTLCFRPTIYHYHPRYQLLPPTRAVNRSAFPSVECLDTIDERCSLLRFVILPSLRRLIVRSYDPLGVNLEDFVRESAPPLEELYLTCELDGEGGASGPLFSLTPSLKKLRLPLSQSFMQILTLSSSGKEYNCPLLEEVTFDIRDTTWMTLEESVQMWIAAADMIRSRWRSPKRRCSGASRRDTTTKSVVDRPIKSLRRIILPDIDQEGWQNHPLHRNIKDCQREGLIVSFRDENWTSLP